MPRRCSWLSTESYLTSQQCQPQSHCAVVPPPTTRCHPIRAWKTSQRGWRKRANREDVGAVGIKEVQDEEARIDRPLSPVFYDGEGCRQLQPIRKSASQSGSSNNLTVSGSVRNRATFRRKQEQKKLERLDIQVGSIPPCQ